MAHRIRQTWKKGTSLNGNAVEVDEAFFGEKESNKHPDKKLNAGRVPLARRAVAGAKDRDTGQIRRRSRFPDTKADTLQGFARQHVEKGGTMYSDDAVAYADFDHVAKHESVKHSIGEYVKGMAHVNGMESFWSMMKRRPATAGMAVVVSPRGLRIASLIHLHKSPTKAKTADRAEKIMVETISRFVLFHLRFSSSTSS